MYNNKKVAHLRASSWFSFFSFGEILVLQLVLVRLNQVHLMGLAGSYGSRPKHLLVHHHMVNRVLPEMLRTQRSGGPASGGYSARVASARPGQVGIVLGVHMVGVLHLEVLIWWQWRRSR